MRYELSNHVTPLKALISREEAKQAKEIAKAKGMTLQGWLGQLIKEQIAKESLYDRG